MSNTVKKLSIFCLVLILVFAYSYPLCAQNAQPIGKITHAGVVQLIRDTSSEPVCSTMSVPMLVLADTYITVINRSNLLLEARIIVYDSNGNMVSSATILDVPAKGNRTVSLARLIYNSGIYDIKLKKYTYEILWHYPFVQQVIETINQMALEAKIEEFAIPTINQIPISVEIKEVIFVRPQALLCTVINPEIVFSPKSTMIKTWSETKLGKEDIQWLYPVLQPAG